MQYIATTCCGFDCPQRVVLQAGQTTQAHLHYAITGGSGGLGLLFASWLQQAGAQSLLLLGRSGRAAAPTDLANLAGGGCQTDISRADMAHAEEAAAALCNASSLAGIIHAAGTQVSLSAFEC